MNARSQHGAFANVRPVVGRPFEEAIRILWPEPVAVDIIGNFRHTLETGVPYYSKDFVNPRADVDQVEGYEWELHQLQLSDGRAGVVCYYYDSTELRHAEHKLREADRHKDEFLATLAHELRNPLAPIRNGLQIMQLAGDDARTVANARAMLERQVGQLSQLIDDLMDLARIQRGKVALQKTRVRLADAINDAADTVHPLVVQRGHRLTVDVQPDALYLFADRTRLCQIVANLLNNAAKYTDSGGDIRLMVHRQGSDAVVSVQDNGVGIPASMLRTVFDMFSQVDRSLEKADGGLGIGLHIVKRLVELHGGTIVAESDGQGLGSRFTVRLPLMTTTADAEGSATEHTDLAQSPGRRILVADDNADGASSLAMMLRMLGHETETVGDGVEAVSMAATFRPGVILMDIGMPKLNGYDACRRIRAEEWGKRIVIVAQTGWGQSEDKRAAADAGFDAHVVKPVDPAALMRMLTALPGNVDTGDGAAGDAGAVSRRAAPTD